MTTTTHDSPVQGKIRKDRLATVINGQVWFLKKVTISHITHLSGANPYDMMLVGSSEIIFSDRLSASEQERCLIDWLQRDNPQPGVGSHWDVVEASREDSLIVSHTYHHVNKTA